MTYTITLDTPMSFQEALQHLNDGKCVGIRPNNNTNFLVPYKYGMDVKALYKEHEESDLERLNEKLKDFSQDELRVIKTILNNKAL